MSVTTTPMQQIIESLAQRKQASTISPKDTEHQHQRGKLTAEERIALLLDLGSFTELGSLMRARSTAAKTQFDGDGVITGHGTINGRKVCVYAQDFTKMGGSLGEIQAKKIARAIEMAMKNGIPVIGLIDSGGSRIQEGLRSLEGYAKIFNRNVAASGIIPQISVILGPSAGGASYSPALTDFIFMVDGVSNMFITGPSVVEATTGESVSTEKLGGTTIHAKKSGVCHFAYVDEHSCLEGVRKLFSYLPSHFLETPPTHEVMQENVDSPENILSLVPTDPQKTYDAKKLIALLVDHGSFFEVQELFAKNIVVGFAHIAGRTVGIVANQTHQLAGCLDIDASDKLARFARTCSAFSIPLINLVDCPGYLPGIEQEHHGIIRHGAKVLYAYAEAKVPKIAIVIRKAYGGAYIALAAKNLGYDITLAWPTAEIAVMGAEQAVKLIHKRDIEQAPDQAQYMQQKIQEYKDTIMNPYIAAEQGYIDDIINPAETRNVIIATLHLLENKHEGKRNRIGNIPL